MRRFLTAVMLLAALVWGGMVGWSINSPETKARHDIRTAAFVVMFGAGMFTPAARRREPSEEEEF